MPLSARRPLALVALTALAAATTTQAVATAPPAKHAKAKRKAPKKARAVKLGGGVAWVPPAIAATTRAPLTGTSTANAGGGAIGNGTPGPDGDPTSGYAAQTPALPTDPPTQQALGATVDERTGYTLRLSRTTLAAGTVVVQLVNQGEDPHNLRIVRTDAAAAPTDLPETGPQQQTTTTLTLAPGSYYLFCTLTTPRSHEQAGMHATLRVEP